MTTNTINIPLRGWIAFDTDTNSYIYVGYKPTLKWLVPICECDTSIDVAIPSDWNPVSAQVEHLTQAINAITDEFHRRREELMEQISKLQALTFSDN